MSTTIPQPVRPSSRSQLIHQLRNRVTVANQRADDAIRAYEALNGSLHAEYGGGAEYRIAKRDHVELSEHARRAEFHSAQATRFALALIVELLSELTDRAGISG